MKIKATSTNMISVKARALYIISSILPGLLLLYGLFMFFNSGQMALAATVNSIEKTTDIETKGQKAIAFSKEEAPVVANDQPHPTEKSAIMPVVDILYTSLNDPVEQPMPPIRIPIIQGSDDAGHHCSHVSEAIDWNEVSLGHCDDESEAIGGFRFTQVDIPEDVPVDIYIEFSVESVLSNTIVPILIYGEAVVDSSTFSANDLPSDRFAQSTLTDEIVTWHVGDWQYLPVDPEFCCSITHVRTPSLNPIIAEMIAEGWVNGGSLTFLTRPGGDALHPFPPVGVDYANSRRVVAYDREDTPGAQPTLVIQPLPPLPDGMARSAGAECPLCGASSAVGWVGGPINSENGNLSYQQTDLSMPLMGGNLEFRRTYASNAVDLYTSTLGFGWTHNFDMRLNLSGFPDTVEFQASGGSSLVFFHNGDNTYSSYPGVTAELIYDGLDFTLTAFDQTVYHFGPDGNLLNQTDAAGNIITFLYNINNQLNIAGQGTRYFIYAYDELDRLTSVTDSLMGRKVTLEYDTNGDLITVTNALDLPTTYAYSGTTHLLTKVTDPSGTVVEETAYDNNGHAYQQWDGAGNLLVEIDYSLEDMRVVTENGIVMTYTYHPLRGTLLDVTFACEDNVAGCQAGSFVDRDYNFNPRFVEDASGNTTTIAWDEGGSNLEYMQDAMGHETFMTYDQNNNLIQTADARDNTTSYFYDNPSFPTFLTRMTDALDKTTYYTPTTTLDGVLGLLKQQEDPDGRITSYAYNKFGQVTQTVRAAGTIEAITLTYGYDAVGRLITTTQSSPSESHTSLNVYDNGDRLIATIANWTGSDPATWQADCDTSSGGRDTNVCTQYGYDNAGRTISMTNALGQTDLTFYDAAGRSFLSVSNYDGLPFNPADPLPDLCDFSNPDPEFNLCSQTEYDAFGRVYTSTDTLGRQSVNEYDSLGRISRTVTNWQDGVFNANDPDGDIETVYQYDANGNTIIVTDTVGRMTRTFYDALNRVEGTINNWDGSTVLDDCSSLPTIRDGNICTQYEYDEVGNTIIVTDTLGRMTRTFYDELNRVEATVTNWQPTLTSPDNCFLSASNDALENICTLYGYDDTGNQITTTNALNQTSLTVYDGANRPFLTIQNWDGTTTIDDESNCSFPPAESDTNVCSVTYFDTLGRRSGSRDAMGNLTDYEYDGLGRLITTTRYLENGTVPVETVVEYDGLGNRLTQTDAVGNDISFVYDELNRMETSTTEEGVTHTSYFNAAGWVTQTVDTLQHATTFGYDDLGRRLSVTDAESNVTQYEYDALGNQTAMIDAETIRTTYEYDDLNRLERVIENDVPGSNPTNESDVVTEYSYDALGNQVHITNALGLTNTYTIYDVLNRPTIVEDALGNQTYTQYNALGYRTVMIDGNDAVTTYGYDGLNRLTTVNYPADGITVQYQYDALGNRTVMTDDLGTTSHDYDDLYRLIEVTDPFTATVGYSYDKVGNRTSLTYPDSRVVTYTYDMDNRLETVLDWDTGLTTYEYDPAGRLITTTLPNGVVSVNTFDDANRLTNLSHTSSNDVLIANFAYELDKVGNRTTVTETIRQSGVLAGVMAFLEENGQLVLEAESGTSSAGTTHTWNSQTAQSDYAGSAYMRALPDIGQQVDASATANSPGLDFTVQIDNPGSYTVWARGMAPDAAGDSLHVGVDNGTPTTAANLTGFAPNAWTWSRLTMSSTNATVDLSSSGIYTLNVSMAEDGLRLDKLLLVTDTATIPTGQGPLESSTTTALPNLGSHTIEYDYDDLYRMIDVTYTGDITGTYAYEYNAVGNRTTYTATITTTTVTTYTYNEANQLDTAKELSSPDIWHFVYDDNGNLVRQVPNGLTPADGEVRYTYDQRNLLVQIENHDGSSYLPQAEMKYDGNGNRLQSISYILGTAMTTTFTLDGLNNSLPLALDNGLETRNILYGLFGLGEFSSEWTYFLGDGQFSMRQLMDSNGNIALTRTYGPFGRILQEAGNGNAIFGFAGAQSGGSGLLYINGRYYDPATGRFLSPGNNVDPMRPGTLNGYLSAIFLFGPFGAVIWRKRKKRGGRYDLMLFLALGIGLGLLLVSCDDDSNSNSGGTPVHFFGTNTPIVPGQPPEITIVTTTPTWTSTPASPTGTPTTLPSPTSTPTRIVQVNLATHPKISQYSSDVVNVFGYNACGLVAATAPFVSPNVPPYIDTMKAIVENAPPGSYGSGKGIQPGNYVQGLKGVYGAGNVTEHNNWTIDAMFNALVSNQIVIVDIKVQRSTEIPSATPDNYAHFARVLGIDRNLDEIYIENTLSSAGSYWKVSLTTFEYELWIHPETSVSLPAPDAQDVTKWAVTIASGATPSTLQTPTPAP